MNVWAPFVSRFHLSTEMFVDRVTRPHMTKTISSPLNNDRTPMQKTRNNKNNNKYEGAESFFKKIK